MPRSRLLLPALVATLALAGASADAQLVTNGSFETSSTISNPGGFTTLGAGSTAIDGWTVSPGAGIDYIGTYWVAADGARSIDLSALGMGGIFQDIVTVPGSTYRLSFAMAGNPEGGPTMKSMLVSAGATNQTFTFDITGHSKPAMGWQTFSMHFVASAATSRIEFLSLNNTATGPTLDAVGVELVQGMNTVPEPATFALFGGGLGLVGLIARRRRAQG